MIKNHFKIAWRTLLKSKGYSLINILGLSAGMAVAILIGLWMYDELSYESYNPNRDRIAQVMQSQTFDDVINIGPSGPMPLGQALREKYGNEFKYVVRASWPGSHTLASGDKVLSKSGIFMEPEAPKMLGLKMLRGSLDALKDPNSVIISESAATDIFGTEDPMGKTVTIDSKLTAKVAGVYENIADNSGFSSMRFFAPWDLYVSSENWLRESKDNWENSSFQTFIQLADHSDFDKVSSKIKNLINENVTGDKKFKPKLFLFPMDKWHLYSEFKDGKNIGGKIQFVWLFGIIGAFVLLLACINFMNLSTARSEKRAKEVGIRKAMGSMRLQLIKQFFSESLLVAILAFVIALVLVQLCLPYFNALSVKKLNILWENEIFWLASIGFVLFTGLIAGSYPALYLSSFEPVKVLKGTFRPGRFAALPRQVLVVLQFSTSIVLIIGTIIVFRQINFAKDRPVGYDREGLIAIQVNTSEIHDHFDAFRADMHKTGAIAELGESQSPTTGVYSNASGFKWQGKDPEQAINFGLSRVSVEFGKTVGWQFIDGRDFSRAYPTDSAGLVMNEAAIKSMGMKNPVGQPIQYNGVDLKIIGVIKNMLMESPYKEPRPIVFYLSKNRGNFILIRLKPGTNLTGSLNKIEQVYKRYSPSAYFDYSFVDEDYAAKFEGVERIGKIATLFACLAIFISCLGLFGMASFTAEQRTKEIGVRKVLGAKVADIWRMLSKEFVLLVLISCMIGSPIAFYFLHDWLESFEYRTEISWWIFAVSIAGALLITIITVSFQAIKAALANPVKSLRAE